MYLVEQIRKGRIYRSINCLIVEVLSSSEGSIVRELDLQGLGTLDLGAREVAGKDGLKEGSEDNLSTTE